MISNIKKVANELFALDYWKRLHKRLYFLNGTNSSRSIPQICHVKGSSSDVESVVQDAHQPKPKPLSSTLVTASKVPFARILFSKLKFGTYTSALALQDNAFAPKLVSNTLGFVVSREMSSIRPIMAVEQLLLQQSKLLPSLLKSLKEIVPTESNKKIHSSIVTSNIVRGEFMADSPKAFVQKLASYQQELNKQLNDLAAWAKSLQNISVQFQFVDGKIAISGPENIVKEVIKPQLSMNFSCLDAWNADAQQPEAQYMYKNADLDKHALKEFPACAENYVDSFEMSSASSSLKEHFPNMTDEELQVFTTWSDCTSPQYSN